MNMRYSIRLTIDGADYTAIYSYRENGSVRFYSIMKNGKDVWKSGSITSAIMSKIRKAIDEE